MSRPLAASSLQTGLGTIRSRSLAHSIRLQPRRAAFMAPMLWRLRAFPDFCEPCLPRPVEQPPAGNGHDWTERFPLIVEALSTLKVATCLIDGESLRAYKRKWMVF